MFLKVIAKTLEKYRSPRYRDRRAHYASSALTDLREQVWDWRKEPETNAPDLKGRMTMLMGTVIEEGVIKHILSHAHFFNLHLIGTQIQVGGSNPAWDGNLDGLFCYRDKETGKLQKPHVLEIKTAHGYGADLIVREFKPKESYLLQLGLYLKDLSEKGVTNTGILLYVLLSDNNFGEMLAFNCSYENGKISCSSVEKLFSQETVQGLDIEVDVLKALERFKEVDAHLQNKTTPAAEYKYKHALTPEYLYSVSDNQLKQALRGEKILGDWQPRYSRYFDKIIKEDNLVREYTEKEYELLRNELARRGKKKKGA